MTLKALTAVLMTVVVSLAALASEQRRMHVEIAIDEDGDADVHVMKEVRKIKIIKSGDDVTLLDADSLHDDHGIHSDEEHEVIIIKKEVDVAN